MWRIVAVIAAVLGCGSGTRTGEVRDAAPEPGASRHETDAPGVDEVAAVADAPVEPDVAHAPEAGVSLDLSSPGDIVRGEVTGFRSCASPSGCVSTAICTSPFCSLKCAPEGVHCDSSLCEITGGDGCTASCNEADCQISLGARAKVYCSESEHDYQCVARCGPECEATCDSESWCRIEAGDRSKLRCEADEYPCTFICGAGCEVLVQSTFPPLRLTLIATASVGEGSTVRCPGCEVKCSGRCTVTCGVDKACECTGTGCEVSRM